MNRKSGIYMLLDLRFVNRRLTNALFIFAHFDIYYFFVDADKARIAGSFLHYRGANSSICVLFQL